MRRVITPQELGSRPESELRALFHKAQQELVQSETGTPDRRIALANVEAIGRALACSMRR
jgi:hypothetical protein